MDHVVASAAPRLAGAPHIEPIEFRGTGAEYFRIWIVNLCLSVVTLGIYSAWAKVRRLRYFYGNTFLEGSAFGYHASPMAILKGRLIAVACFALYTLTDRFMQPLAAALAVAFFLALPWIVVRSQAFHMRMTSYRNIRFDFERRYREAAVIFLGWPFLLLLTLGLLLPAWVARRYRFLVNSTRFGHAAFSAEFSVGRIYAIYMRASLLLLLSVFLIVALGVAIVVGVVGVTSMEDLQQIRQIPQENLPQLILAATVLFYLLLLPLLMGVAAYVQAAALNTVYSGMRLGPHAFGSELRAGRLWWIQFSNLVLIVLTAGLYIPWASVRMARYRAACMSMLVHGTLDDFVTSQRAAGSAIGEELGELFDVDLAV